MKYACIGLCLEKSAGTSVSICLHFYGIRDDIERKSVAIALFFKDKRDTLTKLQIAYSFSTESRSLKVLEKREIAFAQVNGLQVWDDATGSLPKAKS